MRGITTHVLDIVKGGGAAGMEVELRAPGGQHLTATLDAGGRATLAETLVAGVYELRFHAAAYRRAAEFYDIIPVRILVHEPERHYHVPLILSAYGYTTYRGG
ncbi:hydroxyisourate hydrolase [Acidocella sp.]|jgi:hydroxyisourate hydrolase|uniref:hydroxyisourate hydrolase n=1 Tax=Acidocella sp. TaxID=50710 RepID=UPI002637CA6D|nr:hydroxyisourate hydrolase [Acidocella sp.]